VLSQMKNLNTKKKSRPYSVQL